MELLNLSRKLIMTTTNKLSRRHALALLAGTTLPAFAQTPAQTSVFPAAGKTIKIIVPFAAGAGTDAMGRLMAQRLGEVMNATSFQADSRMAVADCSAAAATSLSCHNKEFRLKKTKKFFNN